MLGLIYLYTNMATVYLDVGCRMKQQWMCSHMMPSYLVTDTQTCIIGSILLPTGNGHSALTQREFKSELFTEKIKSSARISD